MQVFKLHPDALIPIRQTTGSIGYDLHALEDTKMVVNGPTVIRTGLQVRVPQGHYGRIAPRSSLAVKHGIDVLAGVIDRDFRGEVKVVLMQLKDDEPYQIKKGERIAQLILECASEMAVMEVDAEMPLEEREGGFGSTNQ